MAIQGAYMHSSDLKRFIWWLAPYICTYIQYYVDAQYSYFYIKSEAFLSIASINACALKQIHRSQGIVLLQMLERIKK